MRWTWALRSIMSTIQRGDDEIEVEVSFTVQRPERDVGIFESYADDVEISTPNGKPFDATPEEFAALAEKANEQIEEGG